MRSPSLLRKFSPIVVAVSLLLGTLPGSALAATDSSCESNFKASYNAEKGILFFGAARTISSKIDVDYAVNKMVEVARGAGMRVDAPSIDKAKQQASVYMISPNAPIRNLEMVFTADAPTGALSIGTAMKADVRPDAEQLRDYMCGLVAKVGASKSLTATDLMAREAFGGMGEDYPKRDAALAAAKAVVRKLALADPNSPESRAAAAAARTAPPTREEKLRPLTPKQPFNAALASAGLQEGSATIQGDACVARNGQIAVARDIPVYLYPATPYLVEVVDLMHKAKAGRDRLVIDPGFSRHRLEGQTNSEGEFRFSRLKPGRYYLYAEMGSTFGYQREVNIGSFYDNYGGGTITENQQYNVSFDDVLEKYVDVKQDGQSLKVTLSPRLTLRGGYAGLLGCR